MAITKELEIIVDTSESQKPVDDLGKSLDNVDKSIDDINKKGSKGMTNLDKSTKKASGGVKNLTGTFKILSTTLKALGIGLIISAVAGLTEAFKSNQRIVDAVGTIFETIGIVLTQVTDALVRTYDAVSQSTDNFDALGKVVKGILTIALTPMKLTFFAIKLAIQQAQLAWEKSFFGDKDPETIKELNKAIEETKQNLIEVGTEALEAGKDIVNNFSEAIEEVTEIGKTAINELSEVSIKTAHEQAQVLVQARNNAKLLAVAQQGLIEQYETQAERLRQIRDSDLSGIDVRKKANEDLAIVLQKQNEAMLKNADALIHIAKLELDRNNTIENQVALQEALNEKKAIENRITGQQSEQLTNLNSLIREELQLKESILQADTERSLNAQKFNAELISDEQKRLDELIRINELEKELRQKDLEDKINSYNKDTQSRIDAENELKDFLQENSQELITLRQKQKEANDKALKDEEKREMAVGNAKVAIAENVSTLVQGIAGRDSAIGKGVALAQATISGIEGVQNAYTTAQKSPITVGFPAYPIVQAGLAGAFSALQIRQILKTDPTGRTTPSPSQSGGGASAPAFNLVQGTEASQIVDSINQQGQDPVQAFVVSGEVTTQAQLDRQIETRASI